MMEMNNSTEVNVSTINNYKSRVNRHICKEKMHKILKEKRSKRKNTQMKKGG